MAKIKYDDTELTKEIKSSWNNLNKKGLVKSTNSKKTVKKAKPKK